MLLFSRYILILLRENTLCKLQSAVVLIGFRFEFHFLPAIRHAVGPVAIIGDNLASHINARVLQLCSDHHVKFICLPPNATHICQPLDVAVYRPLKGYWRRVLTEWKDSDEGTYRSVSTYEN